MLSVLSSLKRSQLLGRYINSNNINRSSSFPSLFQYKGSSNACVGVSTNIVVSSTIEWNQLYRGVSKKKQRKLEKQKDKLKQKELKKEKAREKEKDKQRKEQIAQAESKRQEKKEKAVPKERKRPTWKGRNEAPLPETLLLQRTISALDVLDISDTSIPRITVQELKGLLDSSEEKKKVLLIDLRDKIYEGEPLIEGSFRMPGTYFILSI